MSTTPTAQRFVEELEAYRSPEQREKHQRYFKTGEGQYGEGDQFIGVRMGQIFALAKEFIEMPPGEIEELLESPVHEVRAGALRKKDRQRLLRFLDGYAATMSRTKLRYAIEHLDGEQRAHYLSLKQATEAGQDRGGDRS
jgi:DNA alkylation repair enzyme